MSKTKDYALYTEAPLNLRHVKLHSMGLGHLAKWGKKLGVTTPPPFSMSPNYLGSNTWWLVLSVTNPIRTHLSTILQQSGTQDIPSHITVMFGWVLWLTVVNCGSPWFTVVDCGQLWLTVVNHNSPQPPKCQAPSGTPVKVDQVRSHWLFCAMAS